MIALIGFVATLLLASTVTTSASPIERRAYTGQASWTEQGLGACGITATDDQLVTAVQAHYFDSYPGYKGGNPNKNPLCGRNITATYNGNVVTVRVTDRSVGGAKYDLNLSPAAFNVLDNTADGVIDGVSWVQH
ncbi:hypothetical protein BS47DRAFT_1343883 [Hydnum rufescens UP504]|uniref:RlpA-like protein double-psi beta-barrel domain-containing protein n=1 Tax=Hydnum rufescens UP504 TaxID=1448309 RepID=A0A9P6AYE8_9AGAM|nr:hypothetical protein BS47DRAFT_1343883 [Hydnum rufescens UP504]